MYDDVLNGLGVGSACRGETRGGRLLAGFTATPRRFWRSDLIGRNSQQSSSAGSLMHLLGVQNDNKGMALKYVARGRRCSSFSSKAHLVFVDAFLDSPPAAHEQPPQCSFYLLPHYKHAEVYHVKPRREEVPRSERPCSHLPNSSLPPLRFPLKTSVALVPSKRADGLSLRPFFDHSIGSLDLHWGIANGYLVDIHAFAVRTTTDIAALPTRMQVSRRYSLLFLLSVYRV